MKRDMMFISLGLSLLAAACGGKKEETRPASAPVVRGVKVEPVQPLSVEEGYEALGTVRSRTVSVLSAKVVGNIVAVHVREGDRVSAGQLLVEIDSRDTQTQVDKAQAGLREAQEALEEVERGIGAAEAGKVAAEANRDLATSTYNRFKALFERGSVSRQEFEEVQAKQRAADAEAKRATEVRDSLLARRRQVAAKMDQAKADIANARIYVAYARITSPMAGVVVARQAEVGAMAAPGVPLVTVEDDARYRLEASVEESRIGRIRKGDRVGVKLDVADAGVLEGKVEEVSPSADPSTRTYLVKIGLPPTKGVSLRSGLFGRALFRIGQRQVLTLPHTAVVQRGQLTGVYAVGEGNTARLRLIQTGQTFGDRVEVLSGLTAGEKVVVEGAERVADGSRIE